jgi:hypothetical protein
MSALVELDIATIKQKWIKNLGRKLLLPSFKIVEFLLK